MKKKLIMVVIGFVVMSQMQVTAAGNLTNKRVVSTTGIEKYESKTYEEKYVIEQNTITCSYGKRMYYPSLKSNGKILPWTPFEKDANTYLKWESETDQNLDLAWEGFTFDYASQSNLSLFLEKNEETYVFVYTNDNMAIRLQVAQDTGKRYLTVEADDDEHEITVLGDGETVSFKNKANDAYTCSTTYNHYQFIMDEETFHLSIPAKLNDQSRHDSPSQSRDIQKTQPEKKSETETTPTVGVEEEPTSEIKETP